MHPYSQNVLFRLKATSLLPPSDVTFFSHCPKCPLYGWLLFLWQDKHTVSCLKDFAHSKDLKVELQRRWISEIMDLRLCCEFSFLCRCWSAVWGGVWRDGCQRGCKRWAQASCDGGSSAQGQVKFTLCLMKANTYPAPLLYSDRIKAIVWPEIKILSFMIRSKPVWLPLFCGTRKKRY